MELTSYLTFNGQAEEAANFYSDALGGTIEELFRYESMPDLPNMPEVPDGYNDKVLHCSISFPDGTLSLADSMPNDPRTFGNGGHILTLKTDSIDQTEEIYKKLSEGAQTIKHELGETFFAKRYAEVVDRYGVLWALMHE